MSAGPRPEGPAWPYGSPARIDALAARAAARDPDAVAVVAADAVLDYRALARAVGAGAERLRELGVRPGDRVVIVCENCAGALVLALAAAAADAWAVPVNARLSPREIDAIRAHCRPRRTFFTAEVSPEAVAHGMRLAAMDAGFSGLGRLLATACDEAAAAEPSPAEPERRVAALIYTSGTTGTPKGVMLSHRNLLFAASSGATLRRIGPGDRIYAALPISHVFGLASVCMSALLAGATLHLEPRFTPAGLADALEHSGISVLPGVPAMYTRLLEYAQSAGRPIRAPRLRFAYAGGAPLDPALKTAVEAALGQPLHNGYGLTETSPTVSSTLIDAPRADLSVGPPVTGIEVRIAGADGRPVVRGEVGALHVRGPNVMLGYYRDADATARAIDGEGWLDTGDLARQEPDGSLFIAGRTKELIIRSGFNVYPVEVESVLNGHPAVAQSAVVGRAAPGNEDIVAFVEPRAGTRVTEGELAAFCAERLAPYKVPAAIVLMAPLPASSTGKVLKARLREIAAGWVVRRST